MRSQTAVRRRRTEAAAIEEDNERAFPQVRAAVVGLAGLEPAASSLSEIDGEAPCYPAFSEVVPIHEHHRDGVNHAHPHQLAVAIYWRTHGAPGHGLGIVRFRLVGVDVEQARFPAIM
jgi:hypothetical protein